MIVTDATNLPRVMQCLGSLEMPAAIQNVDDTEARDEGNAAHSMAQRVFQGEDIAALINTRAYNGYLMDAEMARHVSTYLSSLDCGEMEVVTTVETPNWIVNARADHISWRCPETLIVDDFKYGHRLVEPEMNWTLIAHAIGYCISRQICPPTIILRIHQPRRHHPDGPLREWVINYEQLMGFYHLIDRHLSSGDNRLITGPNCHSCYSAQTCPAYREASMNAIDAASVLFSDDLAPEILSAELDLLQQAFDVIGGRLKALQELARHKIQSGTILPMYGLEAQYANRRYKKIFATPKAIKSLVSVSCTEETLVTPAELERRGVSSEILSLLTERPMTGSKLVRGDADKRARRQLKKGK